MIETIILSDSIKDKVNLKQFVHSETINIQKLNCKDELIFITFPYNDNLKIRKNYNIKSIYIEEDNYNFKENLNFQFYSFEKTNEVKLITVCINAKLFWSNLDYVRN